jgi:predicted helicase
MLTYSALSSKPASNSSKSMSTTNNNPNTNSPKQNREERRKTRLPRHEDEVEQDKTSIIYNQLFTLNGIPPETYEYRLGNRSAPEWIIDQYQVSTDKRSGTPTIQIGPDDPQYILHLIGQVITVSLETVNIVKALPEFTTSQISTAHV